MIEHKDILGQVIKAGDLVVSGIDKMGIHIFVVQPDPTDKYKKMIPLNFLVEPMLSDYYVQHVLKQSTSKSKNIMIFRTGPKCVKIEGPSLTAYLLSNPNLAKKVNEHAQS